MAAGMSEGARTWLFTPADRPDRCCKALGSEADQVIWDLEDGVAPERKEAAREALRSLLDGQAGGREPWVRIRSPLSDGGEADLALLSERGALGRVVLPKADADSLAALARVAAHGRWLLLIESARGLWDLVQGRLAVPPQVRARLAFGALDYALDVGIDPGPDEMELLHARSQIVWASRALGLCPPIDSVHPRFGDPEGLAKSAARAARLGFGGKLAIHPAQLSPIARAFVPSAAEVEWARAVMAAVSTGGAGALALDGAMVDRPVVERARAILDAARQGAPDPEAGADR